MRPSREALFDANLRALRSRSGRLAELVALAVPYPLEAETARTGAASARAGKTWLHSRYDPEAEGRRVAEEAVATGAELVLFLGLGLGYAARAALAAGASIALVESDPGWLAALCGLADLSDILGNERCSLVLCPEGRGLGDFLSEAAPRTIVAVENGATMASFPETAALLRDQISDYKKRDRINAATLKRFGRLWVRNLARNLRHAASLPGVAAYDKVCSGLPALVLAAGPSLDDIGPLLPLLAERAVVICVDTALRSALRAGIEPDFVLVVDPQYLNARHLDRCQSPDSVLVTEAAVWPSVLRFCQGRTVLCSSIYPLGRYVEKRLGQAKGSLGAGGSVSTSAWDLARVIGCAPVYMAGLDLAFPGGRTHARASLFEQRSLAEGSRIAPASTAAFLAMHGGRPFVARANDGGDVTSDERLALYSSWFERTSAGHPETPTFNLSPGGLAIPGLAYAETATLLELPARRDEIAARLSAARLQTQTTPGPRADSAAIIGELVHELERLAALADHAVQVAEAARGQSGPVLAQALAELDRLDAELLDSEARDVIGFLFSSVAEAVGGRARNLEDSLSHSSRLYRAVAESARWHASCLSCF